MRFPLPLLLCFGVLALAGCSTVIVEKSPDTGTTEIFNSKPTLVEEGMASWYRDHRTASGERFSGTALAAAHKKLPFGTKVRVIDLKTHKSIIVRINDRGPYIKGRIIDLTVGAARQLGVYERGIAKVRIEALREIPIMGKPNLKPEEKKRQAAAATSAKPTPTPAKPAAAKPTPAPTKPTAKPSPTPTKPAPKPTPAPIKPAAAKSSPTPTKPVAKPTPAKPSPTPSKPAATPKPTPVEATSAQSAKPAPTPPSFRNRRGTH